MPNTSESAVRTASYNLTNEYLTVKYRSLSKAPLNILTSVIASIVSQNAGPTDPALVLSYIKGNFTRLQYPEMIAAVKGTAGSFTLVNNIWLSGGDGEAVYEGLINQPAAVTVTMLSNENMWVTSDRGNINIDGIGAAARDFNMSIPFTARLPAGPVKIRMQATCYLPFDADLLDDARLGYTRFRKYALATLGGQFYLPYSLDMLIVAAYKQNAFERNVPAILVSLFSAYELVSRCY
uniref:VP10 n=1 Tax=Callinectes sapidus reovirus 2 TaxID=2789658 RepID=A0A8K1HQQ3_9REOV|nr:VP10 [Callinectes sapidus reovirus 2]